MRESVFTDRVSTTKIYPAQAGVTLVAEGPRAKSLVRLIAASYGSPAHSIDLPKTIVTTAIPLEGNPANIQTQALKFKVLHNSDKDSADYFELFVNTDLANNKVQLLEKETGYRPAVLKALGVE